jgi:DNA helicase-2/ATP-dependent DNA helicase PcrA
MREQELLGPLNAAQRAAVSSHATQTLVLAGAGSGKTRVLVHRIAWCLETGLAAPSGILAVTFTNKAAAEMRGRIEMLLDRPATGMWVGTFHSIAHRLLRAHWREARLPEQFTIMDSDDQQKLVKRVIRAMGLDDAQWPPKEAQWFINGRKDEGDRPAHIDTAGDPMLSTMVEIYKEYEAACQQSGLVDFAELLLRAYETLRDTPGLLTHYHERFHQVLVDEFQDTNAIQYAWLRLLAGDHANVFAVGDDDQSIYSWRGAQVENMQRFRKDYPKHEIVRLEQNYRSTGGILDAANALIANNTARLGKKLWTDGARGEPIRLYAAFNDLEEARYCVERLRDWHAQGGRYDESAILYRTSAQSRVLEDALRKSDMPYRVHGGFRFYERAEIRDALAYLRLANHRGDDAAFERVVNLPTRGIGNKTLEDLRHTARLERISLWEASQRLISNRELPARAAGALGQFLRLIGRYLAVPPRDGGGNLLQHLLVHGLGQNGVGRAEGGHPVDKINAQFPHVHGELPHAIDEGSITRHLLILIIRGLRGLLGDVQCRYRLLAYGLLVGLTQLRVSVADDLTHARLGKFLWHDILVK